MNATESFLNRLLTAVLPTGRAPRLRLYVLLGLLVAFSQLVDPLADATLKQTVVFWSVRLGAALVSLLAAEWLVRKSLQERFEKLAWLKPAVLTMLVAVLPMTVAEMLLEQYIPQQADFDDSELLAKSVIGAFLSEYLTIATVLVPINLLLWVLIDSRALAIKPEPVASPYKEPAFLKKADGAKAGDVLALEAEEHYVRVHTSAKAYMIHHRLRDAIADMPTSLGTQVHRSWWVSKEAVMKVTRSGRRRILVLSNGLEVPVSDGFLEQAKAEGLL
ncbi:MAG: LytTR family DNA-binding domain-containing protein [Pseudomonadota bacterium]